MAAIPFVPPLEVRYGVTEQVSPLIRRVVAENPSMFTYRGTGTYIIGSGEVAVVDPGPVLESHQAALAAALEGERVTHILGDPLPRRSLSAGPLVGGRDSGPPRSHSALMAPSIARTTW